MKRLLLIALMAAAVVACKKKEDTTPSNSNNNNNTTTQQNLASSTPQNRATVVENFTGVRCQYCPGADKNIKDLETSDGDRFLDLDIHQGIYANPSGTWPNFTTSFGDNLANQ